MYRLTFELTRNECKVEGQIQIHKRKPNYKDGNKARSLNFSGSITPRAPIYAVYYIVINIAS